MAKMIKAKTKTRITYRSKESLSKLRVEAAFLPQRFSWILKIPNMCKYITWLSCFDFFLYLVYRGVTATTLATIQRELAIAIVSDKVKRWRKFLFAKVLKLPNAINYCEQLDTSHWLYFPSNDYSVSLAL